MPRNASLGHMLLYKQERRALLVNTVPGFFFAALLGVARPFMTEIMGRAYQVFVDYTSPSRDLHPVNLLLETGKYTLAFVGLGAGVFLTQMLSVVFLTRHSETVVKRLSADLFHGLAQKPLAWFSQPNALQSGPPVKKDKPASKKGKEGAQTPNSKEHDTSASGLAVIMSRATDDVRLATGQTLGTIVSAVTSITTALIISFVHAPLLTLVMLGTMPIAAIVALVITKKNRPWVHLQREKDASLGSLVEESLTNIVSIKAYGAEPWTLSKFSTLAALTRSLAMRVTLMWTTMTSVVMTIVFCMFVEGFWFGWFLVTRKGYSAGSVNTAFWSCLMAATFFRMLMPMSVKISTGAMSFQKLMDIIKDEPSKHDSMTSASVMNDDSAVNDEGTSPQRSRFFSRRSRKRIEDVEMSPVSDKSMSPREPHLSSPNPALGRSSFIPVSFQGDLALEDVTFTYPNAKAPVLHGVNMYMQRNKWTFIVGKSGSGKSTVSSLLLGLYSVQEGAVLLDDVSVDSIDKTWLRAHVACLTQGAYVLTDGTFAENILLGLPKAQRAHMSKDELDAKVADACQFALLEEFVLELPQLYDTVMTPARSKMLSGGQKQRIALARAYLRDPDVLILDEALSALDAITGGLMLDALRTWRRGKTTIVITHDMDSLLPSDFVYTMEKGVVNAGGFFADVDKNGGAKQEPDLSDEALVAETVASDTDSYESHPEMYDQIARRESDSELESLESRPQHESILWESTQWGLTQLGTTQWEEGMLIPAQRNSELESVYPPTEYTLTDSPTEPRSAVTDGRSSVTNRHYSLTDGHYSLTDGHHSVTNHLSRQWDIDDEDLEFESDIESLYENVSYERKSFELSDKDLEEIGNAAVKARGSRTRRKHEAAAPAVSTRKKRKGKAAHPPIDRRIVPLKEIFPLLMNLARCGRNAYLLPVCVVLCMAGGAATPVFSSFLGKLIAFLGNAHAGDQVLRLSIGVLALAFAQGIITMAKGWLLQHVNGVWVEELQNRAFERVLKQDLIWHQGENRDPEQILQQIVKDGSDLRNLLNQALESILQTLFMMCMALVWSLVLGWELTLVGVALVPVFLASMVVQSQIMSRVAARIRQARQTASARMFLYFENLHALRGMSMEPHFERQYMDAVHLAYTAGTGSSVWIGVASGSGLGLMYVLEGVLFIVSAALLRSGRMSFSDMLQVLMELIFAMTSASGISTAVPSLSKTLQASALIFELSQMSLNTGSEARGTVNLDTQDETQLPGPVVSLSDVTFRFPGASRNVLQNVSFQVYPHEFVAIVGPSGAGKTTILSLIERLYEPDEGTLLFAGFPADRLDIAYLRSKMALVTQHPQMFQGTIRDNIVLDAQVSPDALLDASRLACVDEFVHEQPKQMDTRIGARAGTLSGGQRQRVQFARALAHSTRDVLLLDESTSALDAATEARIIDNLRELRGRYTVITVTHKLSVMQAADRLVVLGQEGGVVETGAYVDLVGGDGFFAHLVRSGRWDEWLSD